MADQCQNCGEKIEDDKCNSCGAMTGARLRKEMTEAIQGRKPFYYDGPGVQMPELLDADPNCMHEIKDLWSGIKCTKCGGWFCY